MTSLRKVAACFHEAARLFRECAAVVGVVLTSTRIFASPRILAYTRHNRKCHSVCRSARWHTEAGDSSTRGSHDNRHDWSEYVLLFIQVTYTYCTRLKITTHACLTIRKNLGPLAGTTNRMAIQISSALAPGPA